MGDGNRFLMLPLECELDRKESGGVAGAECVRLTVVQLPAPCRSPERGVA